MFSSKLEIFEKRATTAEKEICDLRNELELLRQYIKTEDFEAPVDFRDKYKQLQQENAKLKHRVAILKRAVEGNRKLNVPLHPYKMQTASASSCTKMISISDALYELFEKAILAAYPDLPNLPVTISLSSGNQKYGDYQCNSALAIAQRLREIGRKTTSLEVAKNITSRITELPCLINKIDIAGPGFINIYLARKFGQTVLCNLLTGGQVPPPEVKKQKVVVDFSSPNIAKEMHVGHLRSTIIGDSICRLLEYLGHDVLRLNHIGDWGTQFGMLIAHLQDKFPNYRTTSPSVTDLQAFYKESKARFDSEPEFKKRAYKCVVQLQTLDPDTTNAWRLICEASRQEFEKVYQRLNVRLIERGESFYQSRMESLVRELDSRGLLEDDEGRKIMWGGIRNDGIPMTIVKSDGGFTYDTSDLAALKHRMEEEKAQWVIYVTDAGQSTHFQLLQKCAKRAGILSEQHRVDHVGFGVVLGEDRKKFKTRSGETVKLIELLDEGLKKASEKLVEKGQDKTLSPDEFKAAQEAIGYGCIKYADLSHNRNHEYIFSFDKMLEDRGNTAVYLLYALTRIRSIARTANVSRDQLMKAVETEEISLEHEKEWKLAKVLLRFPDVLIKITKDFYLHQLCEYTYEISCTFSEFYDNCYCVEKDKRGEIVRVNINRILLTEATAIIMEKCFYLLGLKSVERM